MYNMAEAKVGHEVPTFYYLQLKEPIHWVDKVWELPSTTCRLEKNTAHSCNHDYQITVS